MDVCVVGLVASRLRSATVLAASRARQAPSMEARILHSSLGISGPIVANVR